MIRSVEICVADVGSAVEAALGGADRVELCADLASGGTTPSAGLIRQAVLRSGLPVHVLIRPRAGDFVFDPGEIAVMIADIEAARDAGATGVVIGALRPDATIDLAVTTNLFEAAGGLVVTFHKAIDLVPDPLWAIDLLAGIGVQRILTAGGLGPARSQIATLRAIVGRASGRIAVMAGGGIEARDLPSLLDATGVDAVHLGTGVSAPSPPAGPFGRRPAPVEAVRVRRVVRLVRGESGDGTGRSA